MNLCCWTHLLVVFVSAKWQQAAMIRSLIWLRIFFLCLRQWDLCWCETGHLFGEMTSSYSGRIKLWPLWVGSEAAWSFLWFVPFVKVPLICQSVFLTEVTVVPRTSSSVSKFSVSRFHVLCRCCARRWRDGAAANSSARSDDNGKCFHLQRQVLKVITKGWRHRAHPDPAAQPRPLRRRRRRSSAGVWDELISFVFPQREGSVSLVTFGHPKETLC